MSVTMSVAPDYEDVAYARDASVVFRDLRDTYVNSGYSEVINQVTKLSTCSDTFRRELVEKVVTQVHAHIDSIEFHDILAACFVAELAPDFDSLLRTLEGATSVYRHLSMEMNYVAQESDGQAFADSRDQRDDGRCREAEYTCVQWLIEGFGAVKLQPGNLIRLGFLLKIDEGLTTSILRRFDAANVKETLLDEWLDLCLPHGMALRSWREKYFKELVGRLGGSDEDRRTLAGALLPTWGLTYDELVQTMDGLLVADQH
jgi:hypothetical protein